MSVLQMPPNPTLRALDEINARLQAAAATHARLAIVLAEMATAIAGTARMTEEIHALLLQRRDDPPAANDR